MAHTGETSALRDGSWTVIGLFQENDPVSVEPFGEIALELATSWIETGEE